MTRRGVGLSWRDAPNAALPFLFAMAMIVVASHRAATYFISNDATLLEDLYQASIYNRTVISVDYFRDGLVRRGLGGTLTHLLSADWIGSAALFTIVSAIWLAIALALFIYRRGRDAGLLTSAYLVAIILLSPHAFRGWSLDLARTDMLVAGFIAWSALAMATGRTIAAAVLLLIGLLAHETAMIFGVPLLVAMAFDRTRQPLTIVSNRRAAVVLVAGGVAILSAQALLSAPRDVLVEHMLESGLGRTDPHTILSRDIAAYMFVGGARGIKTAMCYNFSFEPRYMLNAAVGLAFLLAYAVILPSFRRRPLGFLLAVILPVMTMLVISSDTARWIRLGFLNAWILAASDLETKHMKAAAMLVGAAVFGLVMKLGLLDYYYTSHVVWRIADALHIPREGPKDEWMTHCDPQWRTVLARS